MATVLSPPEERVVLHDVSWATYERLLAEQQDKSNPRFTYDRGELEIMSPSSEHEEISDLLTQMVYILAEEWDFEYRSFGHTTFRREELQGGFEPDSCFYIGSVDLISGVRRLDPAVHPLPDLAIEIDMTNPSLKKFPLYARMGIPEIWRYNGKRVIILLLEDNNYIEAEVSKSIPRVSASDLTRLLEQGMTLKRSAWVKAVREWARSV